MVNGYELNKNWCIIRHIRIGKCRSVKLTLQFLFSRFQGYFLAIFKVFKAKIFGFSRFSRSKFSVSQGFQGFKTICVSAKYRGEGHTPEFWNGGANFNFGASEESRLISLSYGG